MVKNKANSLGQALGERGRTWDFVLPWGRLPAGGTRHPHPLKRLFSCRCPNGGTPKGMAPPCVPKPRFWPRQARPPLGPLSSGWRAAENRVFGGARAEGRVADGHVFGTWHVAFWILRSKTRVVAWRRAWFLGTVGHLWRGVPATRLGIRLGRGVSFWRHRGAAGFEPGRRGPSERWADLPSFPALVRPAGRADVV